MQWCCTYSPLTCLLTYASSPSAKSGRLATVEDCSVTIASGESVENSRVRTCCCGGETSAKQCPKWDAPLVQGLFFYVRAPCSVSPALKGAQEEVRYGSDNTHRLLCK